MRPQRYVNTLHNKNEVNIKDHFILERKTPDIRFQNLFIRQ